jgi:hypothetical protein
MKILHSKVDGFDEKTNTVYQFHGCFWHGCLKCYDEDTINHVKRECMGDLYEKTKERTFELRNAGYEVVEMWECAWRKNSLSKKSVHVIEPINPRDAYVGGRTEVFKLKAKSTDTCKIKYIDVCSLYPTVMFYDKYPVGHPTKIQKPEKYDPNWFGLIKCKVLAPKNLYVPVLPTRVKLEKNEKLVFSLCRSCTENRTSSCTHNADERMFTGTWTTVEMNKALEKGYKVTEIYEVWHFESSTEIFRLYSRLYENKTRI